MTDDKPQIEVNGVRFSADEVEKVTLKRAGCTIVIEPADSAKKGVGFGRSDAERNSP